jgi:nitrous oxidase accessory protein NosD
MNKHGMAATFILIAAILFVARPAAAQVLVVSADKTECPTAMYTTIQSAIDAAWPGATVHVCAGTYNEQLTINKTLTLEGDNGAIVQPVGVTANVSTLAEPTAAVIFVQNAQNVGIVGLIVDGSQNGLTECAPFLVGVLYQGSTGTIDHDAIRNMQLSANLNGCQSGDAVDVDSTGSPVTVTISNNSINGYQKNGVTASDAGTTAFVRHNVISGVGRTTGAAQNGIQIGYGAAGEVTGNSVANNYYLPCTGPNSCAASATGILIFESDGVLVEDNTLESNQLNIYVQANHANVQQNLIANTPVLDGISLIGNGNQASQNKIVRSDQAAILIAGNNNQVTGNEIGDAPVGILKISGFSGNLIGGNDYFATLVKVQDPAANRTVQVQPRH